MAMTTVLLATFAQSLIKFLLFVTALFLILIVLVQRGRGGGLAGALGGMGGSSAFGAKAGDVFTKITAYTALFWILLCIAATKMGPSGASRLDTSVSGGAAQQFIPGTLNEGSPPEGSAEGSDAGAPAEGGDSTDLGAAPEAETPAQQQEP